ncbi:MAG: queuosine precursor transporter [Desulfohalobiaceae bacterium]
MHSSSLPQAQLPFLLLCSLFVGSLTISAVLAAKIITIWGLSVPAGVLAYALTFICSDVISEIWGKHAARLVVWSGFATLVSVLALIQLALHWPAAEFWGLQQEFAAILGATPRIILASLSAYLCSQLFDVQAYHFWKRVTRDRHLWLRNNFSTALSQLLDSIIFVTVAFYGQMPVLHLIWGQWAVKLGIAILDTGLVYLLVWYLRSRMRTLACS